MNSYINLFQELLSEYDSSLKQIEFKLVRNLSDYDSIVFSSKMTAYRPKVDNALFARIRESGDAPYISFKNKYRSWFEDKNAKIVTAKSIPDYFRIKLEDFDIILKEHEPQFTELAVKICLDAMNFAKFGCCDKFVKCSDMKKCIHEDILYSTACMYRDNLENNRIFYGINKNVRSHQTDNLKIAVIDVETPNGKNDCICSIGIILIENYTVVDKKYYLINPETEFDYRNTLINHISREDVLDAPTFAEIWSMIDCYFGDYIIVGHNVVFDLSCIYKAAQKYNIDINQVQYADTLAIAKDLIPNLKDYKLTTLCDFFEIDLKCHHNALDDSYATANILQNFFNHYYLQITDYLKCYPIKQKTQKRQRHNSTFSYSEETKGLQELRGILFGVTCDGILTDTEILSIRRWLDAHTDLKGNYPFDKIYYSIERVLEDNVISEEERDFLFELFNSFLEPIETQSSDCDIVLNSSLICLTGEFDCMSKYELTEELEKRGAIVKKNVVKNLDYLVVGNKGNDNWSQGNYGNKVKKAMQYNDKGCNISIVKEDDFIACVIDE